MGGQGLLDPGGAIAETSDGDAIRAAPRYRLDRFRREELGEVVEEEPDRPRQATDADRAIAAEIQVQQAMRRGDFENLPGKGKPLPGIGGDRPHDPDWWLRRRPRPSSCPRDGGAASASAAADYGRGSRAS